MSLRVLVREDLVRHRKKTGIFEFCYCYFMRPTFRYTFWLRICHYLKISKIRKWLFFFLPYLVLKHMEYKFGISISTNIKIGGGLHIKHGGSVYINVTSIGKNFTCYQSVTLGVDKNNNKPSIQDNVTVFTGSVVYGNIILKDNSIIGANSVVNKDVPKYTFVAGAPAKIIKTDFEK